MQQPNPGMGYPRIIGTNQEEMESFALLLSLLKGLGGRGDGRVFEGSDYPAVYETGFED